MEGYIVLKNLGQKILLMREKKGISLNAFAKELGISSGYLSQLETGKTETIPLSLLEKLQTELGIIPMVQVDHEQDDSFFCFTRLQHQYQILVKKIPEVADYLLSSLENGMEYFLKS